MEQRLPEKVLKIRAKPDNPWVKEAKDDLGKAHLEKFKSRISDSKENGQVRRAS